MPTVVACESFREPVSAAEACGLISSAAASRTVARILMRTTLSDERDQKMIHV